MKEIKKLSSGLLSRNFKLLKLAYGSSKELIKNRSEELKDQVGSALGSQVDQLINEMGLMKGSVMKVGQMLSLYSDTFLPEELQKVLSKIESQSYFLAWDEIKKNIPHEFFKNLDIEQKPIAAASLGQVHKAIIKETGEQIVLKIQYKGVRKSIDNDIRTLKLILKLSKLLPKDQDLTSVFEEVKRMMYQETDYLQEVENMKIFNEKVKDYPLYYVPKVYEAYCSDTVIATEFIDGVEVRDVDKSKVPNELKEAFYELFFLELFDWRVVQTDAHPGNFLFQLDEEGKAYRWVLLDFGAVKHLDDELHSRFKNFIGATLKDDFKLFIDTLFEDGYLDKDVEFDTSLLENYFQIVREPFNHERFDWGRSDIPEQLLKLAPRIMKEISLHKPPGDSVFIDRKIGGLYFMSKILKSEFGPREITEKYVKL